MGSSVRDVLLAQRLTPGRAAELLAPYGFRDPSGADANLQAMAADPLARALLAEILAPLLESVAGAADPDGALNHLERFAKASGNVRALLSHLKAAPRSIDLLAATFGASGFMAEILIRNPAWFYWLADPDVLAGPRGTGEIARELDAAMASVHSEPRRRDLLRITRRREILHIGVRDLLRLSTVPETVGALSGLAEVLISTAYDIALASAREEAGLAAPAGDAVRFAVLGMGKLGGGELNFSSDVDLVYLYDSDQDEPGLAAAPRAAGEFYRDLARRLTATLGELSGEGYVYRVDLRLRPEGRAGPLAQSLPTTLEYYERRGATWERLALLKAAPVAGDRGLGRSFLEQVGPFVYGRPFERQALEDVRKMKAAIDRKVTLRDEAWRNVKLGRGGIREVELVTQVLQVCHGQRLPQLRVRDTLGALEGLSAAGLLEVHEAETLRAAYLFLRDVENKLQMVADTQTHSLPASPEGLRLCALRLGYRERDGLAAVEAFLADHRSHTDATHRIFEEVIGSDRRLGFGSAPP